MAQTTAKIDASLDFEAVGRFLIGLFLFVTSVLLRGIVLRYGWNHFVVAATGASAISLPVAYGFAAMLYLATTDQPLQKKPEQSFLELMAVSVMFHLALWGLLWLVWQFT